MQGIDAEIERQIALLEAGERIVQETLHFDPVSGRLSTLRSKEEAHDYRYFPEPDLVPLVPTEAMLEAARAALPELPAERAERYDRDWLPEDTARLLRLRAGVGRLLRAGRRATRAPWPTGSPSCARGRTRRRRSSPDALGQARRARRRRAG